jgi:hypothetical protein
MLHEYHVIYSVRYYPLFHVTAVGLGTYYPCIRGHYCIRICSVIHVNGEGCDGAVPAFIGVSTVTYGYWNVEYTWIYSIHTQENSDFTSFEPRVVI